MMNLPELKSKIELMSKHHQTEVLRILSATPDVFLNENNNGTFVNLTEMSGSIITQLVKYTKYVDEQQIRLKNIEDETDRIENTFFQR